jgi:hypothetical protein
MIRERAPMSPIMWVLRDARVITAMLRLMLWRGYRKP